VVILTNKRTSSAAEFFCLSMHQIPDVTTIGDTTSGTLSYNEYHNLPNGWVYRMSISTTSTLNGEIYEGIGLPPDVPLWNAQHDSISKRDYIFEKAVAVINNKNKTN
jgi:carboxyl-terminal processing protease